MKSIVCAVCMLSLLAACASIDPVKQYAAAIDRVHANGDPILIYDRPADNALGFINVSSHPINKVELKVAVCGSGGQTSADLDPPYWLHIVIKGDFKPGFAFTVRDARVTAINVNGNVINANIKGFDWRSKVVAAWVHFSDGSPKHSFADVQPILTPQLSNHCSPEADPAHGTKWLRSLAAH